MRKITSVCLLLLAACTPKGPVETQATKVLQPYLTVTPSTTAPPEGMFASAETPLPSPTPFEYTVGLGDTLSQIADKFRVSLDALVLTNPGVNPNAMPVGQVLRIPSNPTNLSGEGTPTPVPFPVEQVVCYPSADDGLWCFILIHNDFPDPIENVTAQVTLIDSNGTPIASQTALLPLDILQPDQSLPLSVFFPPDVAADVKPRIRILTATRLIPGDPRYLPASIQNTIVQVSWSGRNAKLSGQVFLPAASTAAGVVSIAAVAYDRANRVVGLHRWESAAGLGAGSTLPFSFIISSAAGSIQRVEFAVEARPPAETTP